MSREAHVPFCEGPLGKFQRSTLLTFREDECQIYADDGAVNLSTIRRKLLNLIKAHPLKDSVAGKMQRACWDAKFRAEILFGQKSTKA
ncbi:hypothetical protein GCM10011607_42440 [Shewanella inventionis]|uniref:Uncharacterized protein n=1 Tax=Shewanella inventionis TaxID=1738770 RepID=A0ABQ1JXT5_9GAMM|nr:hypothetical protein GCM10011607_42440 [Shewanella inventionis]